MFDFIQNIDPVAFYIPIPEFLQNALGLEAQYGIFWYGIIITIGIAIGAYWGGREIEKRGQNVDHYYNGLIVAVVSGYLFARLTYVILDFMQGNGAQYDSLGRILNPRYGGLNILGGFIGAFAICLIYLRWYKLRFWHYADVAGGALLIAQAIGRWGNLINQELYGPPTTLPWGILIGQQHRLTEYAALPAETRFHPTFLYESLALLIGFVVLVWLNGRKRDSWKPGTLFGIFLIWWGGNRAWIEFFRPDQVAIGSSPITYSMIAAVLLALVGVYILLDLYDKLPESAISRRRRRRRTLKPKPRRDEETVSSNQ